MNSKELGKQAAAIQAVNDCLQNDQIVGIGSGSTIVYAVKRIAERVKLEGLHIKCIPTSFQAKNLITSHNLPLVSLEECPKLSIAFDGADEVDHTLVAIKGGGGCLLQEKIVAANADSFIIIADSSKNSVQLGDNWTKGLPIEVVPMAYRCVKQTVEGELGGTLNLREAVKKMGPVVTDNGNFLMDWDFSSAKSKDWAYIDQRLHMIPGVVETGLFINMASKAYFGYSDGQVKIQQADLPVTNGSA